MSASFSRNTPSIIKRSGRGDVDDRLIRRASNDAAGINTADRTVVDGERSVPMDDRTGARLSDVAARKKARSRPRDRDSLVDEHRLCKVENKITVKD